MTKTIGEKTVKAVDDDLNFVGNCRELYSRSHFTYEVERDGKHYLLKGQSAAIGRMVIEKRALDRTSDIERVCNLVHDYGIVSIGDADYDVLLKDWLEGEHPEKLLRMQRFFLKRLVKKIHKRGIAHLDIGWNKNLMLNNKGVELFDFDQAMFKEETSIPMFKMEKRMDLENIQNYA